MTTKAHNFELTIDSLAKIEPILPKLKNSVVSTQIIRWLENFNSEDVELAKDLLMVFEYIPFNEFMYRLNDQLKKILEYIPRGEKILIVPFGKFGKSATLVTYPLKNTPEYAKRLDDCTFLQMRRKHLD